MIGIETDVAVFDNYLESLGCKIEESREGKIVKTPGDTIDELNSMYKGTALVLKPNFAVLELRGKDVLDFLHRISTNSVRELAKDRVTDTIFTTEKGRIIDIASVMNLGDSQMLISSCVHKLKVIRWLEKYIIADDVRVSDTNGRYVVMEMIGPQTGSFITMVGGESLSGIEENAFKLINSEGLMFFLTKLKDKDGLIKYRIIADQNNAVSLIKYLKEHKGPYDFNLVGADAYEAYRIAQGIPSAPSELNDSINPHEAGLLDMVSFTKGCYIGQEVIARLDSYNKVQKLLKGIEFKDNLNGDNNYSLFDESGLEAGSVTSAVYSERLKRHVGLGYVRKHCAENGRTLTARNENGAELKVSVENLPLKR
jgi:folate-binding protein YgfZ